MNQESEKKFVPENEGRGLIERGEDLLQEIDRISSRGMEEREAALEFMANLADYFSKFGKKENFDEETEETIVPLDTWSKTISQEAGKEMPPDALKRIGFLNKTKDTLEKVKLLSSQISEEGRKELENKVLELKVITLSVFKKQVSYLESLLQEIVQRFESKEEKKGKEPAAKLVEPVAEPVAVPAESPAKPEVLRSEKKIRGPEEKSKEELERERPEEGEWVGGKFVSRKQKKLEEQKKEEELRRTPAYEEFVGQAEDEFRSLLEKDKEAREVYSIFVNQITSEVDQLFASGFSPRAVEVAGDLISKKFSQTGIVLDDWHKDFSTGTFQFSHPALGDYKMLIILRTARAWYLAPDYFTKPGKKKYGMVEKCIKPAVIKKLDKPIKAKVKEEEETMGGESRLVEKIKDIDVIITIKGEVS